MGSNIFKQAKVIVIGLLVIGGIWVGISTLGNQPLFDSEFQGAQNYQQSQYDEFLKEDQEKAIRYVRYFASKGDEIAQVGLGFMFYSGETLPKDYNQAFYWFEKAANQGNPSAQGMLGAMYSGGFGVVKDNKLAVYWLEKAATQKSSEAQYALWDLYRHTDSGVANSDKAIYWLRKSAEQGYEQAQSDLNDLYAREEGIIPSGTIVGHTDYDEAIYFMGVYVPHGLKYKGGNISPCRPWSEECFLYSGANWPGGITRFVIKTFIPSENRYVLDFYFGSGCDKESSAEKMFIVQTNSASYSSAGRYLGENSFQKKYFSTEIDKSHWLYKPALTQCKFYKNTLSKEAESRLTISYDIADFENKQIDFGRF